MARRRHCHLEPRPLGMEAYGGPNQGAVAVGGFAWAVEAGDGCPCREGNGTDPRGNPEGPAPAFVAAGAERRYVPGGIPALDQEDLPKTPAWLAAAFEQGAAQSWVDRARLGDSA